MNRILKKPVKKITIEWRLMLGFAGAVLVVVSIGILAWFSMNKIVKGVEKSAHPDERLYLMKIIISQISDAEGYIKSFTITNQPKYLVPYSETVNHIDKNLKRLKKIQSLDSSGAMVDSLSNLVQLKFIVLNQFVNARDTGRMQAILEELSEKASPDAITGTDAESGFLKKIFGTRKRKSGGATIPELDIQTEIETMRYLEAENAAERAKVMLEITQKDGQIMARIRNLINQLEIKYQRGILLQSKEADALASQTNVLIAVFCIVLAVLMFLMGYVIVSYIQKVREITRQLALAKRSSEKLAVAKEMFLANMSHEIRTPLHAIIGFAGQLLTPGHTGDTQAEIAIIKKSSEHLLNLINNILDISRIDADKFVPRSDDFLPGEALHDAVLIVQPMVEEKGLELKQEGDLESLPMVEGDAISFKQIIINLLANAVKFTDKGNVKIKVHSELDKINAILHLNIIISDTGKGISGEKLNLIFEEYEQENQIENARFTGTGLGLTIAKKLVTLLGGNIKLTSEKGLGTSVAVGLPFRLSQAKPKSTKKTMSGKQFKDKYFLIADDELYNTKLLETILKKWGARYDVCFNGTDAASLLNAHKYDAVLLDIRMPGLTGFEVASGIAGNSKHLNFATPMIALTAGNPQEIMDEGQFSGIHLALQKPFSEIELIQILGKVWAENDAFMQEVNIETKLISNPGELEFSMTDLLKMADGDETFAKEMVAVFIENTSKNLVELRNNIELTKWKEIGDLAHVMVPPCRHLHLKTVVSILKEMEAEARTERKDKLPELYASLERLLQAEFKGLETFKPDK